MYTMKGIYPLLLNKDDMGIHTHTHTHGTCIHTYMHACMHAYIHFTIFLHTSIPLQMIRIQGVDHIS